MTAENKEHKQDEALDRGEGNPRPRRTLRHTFFARPRPIHLIMFVLFVVLGVALVTQVRLQRSDPLDTLSEDELIQVLNELEDREEALRTERRELEQQIRELGTEATKLESSRDAAEKAETYAKLAAGTTPVEGPGVVMGVADPSGALTPQVFVTTLAELRNSGAEAIMINDHRLTLSSWFGASTSGKIVVDGQEISSPYTWRAIGEPATLSSALEIRGGAASQMRAYNAVVSIDQRDRLVIEETADPVDPSWATVEEVED